MGYYIEVPKRLNKAEQLVEIYNAGSHRRTQNL